MLFLDIQMPGMNGFELLSRLATQPFVIFTTAYDQHALRAFETNAIDYLLKPIEPEQLERALKKLGRLRPIAKPDWQQNPALPQLLQELTASLREGHATYPNRIASRVGERISFLPLDDVTHFVAQDKLTFAVSIGRRHCVDQTIADLEHRLDPASSSASTVLPWSMSTGFTKSIHGSPAKSCSPSKTRSTRSSPSPATASAP